LPTGSCNGNTPCRTITFAAITAQTYTFRVFVVGVGIGNSVWSDLVSLTLTCGLASANSGTVTAVPADSPSATWIQIKDVSGSDPWFDIASVTNTLSTSCPLATAEYVTDNSGSDTVQSLLVNPNPAVPVTATQYQATPVDVNTPGDTTFTLKVTINGGFVKYFDYKLTLSCGTTTTGLTFTQDALFLTTETLYL